MKQYLNTLIICLILSFFVTTPVFASDLSKAKDYIKAGMMNEAQNELEGVIKDQPLNHKAHKLLGDAYFDQGMLNSASERYTSAIKLNPSYKNEITQKFKNKVKTLLSGNNTFELKKYIEAGKVFGCSLQKKAYDYFKNIGDNAGNPKYSLQNYKKAIQFISNHGEKRAIGIECLRKSVDNESNRKVLEGLAEDILGRGEVEKVFPMEKEIIVFEKTYDDSHTDEHGRIKVVDYKKIDIRPNDILRIKGVVSSQDPEVKYQKNGKWNRISRNGYVEFNFNSSNPIPTKGCEMVYIIKGKGIKVKVKVERKVTPNPDYSILKGIL